MARRPEGATDLSYVGNHDEEEESSPILSEANVGDVTQEGEFAPSPPSVQPLRIAFEEEGKHESKETNNDDHEASEARDEGKGGEASSEGNEENEAPQKCMTGGKRKVRHRRSSSLGATSEFIGAQQEQSKHRRAERVSACTHYATEEELERLMREAERDPDRILAEKSSKLEKTPPGKEDDAPQGERNPLERHWKDFLASIK